METTGKLGADPSTPAGSLRRNGMRGIAHTLMGQAVRFAVQIVSLVALARLLSPTDFGLVAMIMAIIGVAVVIGDAGLSLAALQARELTRAQRDSLFWVNVGLGAGLTAVVWFTAPLIESFYHRDDLTDLCRALGFVFLLNGLSVQYRVDLSRAMRFRPVATIEAGSQIVALVVAIVAALAGMGYWALAIQQLTVPLVTALGFSAYCRWIPGPPRRGVDLARFITFGTNTMLVQVLNYLSTSIPASLLGRSAGAYELGQYNRAYSIFTLPMTQVAAPITRVAIPVLSRLEGRDRLQETLMEAQRVITYTLCFLFGIGAALAPAAIPLVLGDEWAASGDLFAILAIGGVFQGLAYTYYWAYVSLGRTGTQLLTMLPARMAMIGLCAALLPYGPRGVASGLALGLILIWVIGSTIGMRLIGIKAWPIIAGSLPPLAVIAVCIGVSRSIDDLIVSSSNHLLRLGVTSASLVVTITLAWLLIPAVRRGAKGAAVTIMKARGRKS